MKIQLGLSLFLLVASACAMPEGDEAGELDGELAQETSALVAQQAPYLPPLRKIPPEIEQQFARQLAELHCREHPTEASAHFVVPRRLALDPSGGVDCLDVPASRGIWYGEPAFPGVLTGLCRYEWEGSTAPDYLPLALSAARQPTSLRLRITADCRQLQPTCQAVTSCAAATPATRPTAEEIASHFTPETLPCPACRGSVAGRKLVAVLSPEMATKPLVSAEIIKNGRRYTTTFRPSGSQVDSYDIPDDFPDTSDVEFRAFLSAGAAPAP